MSEKQRVLLVVMDGVGERPEKVGNAVAAAHTPTLDWLRMHALTRTLWAHGPHVGLPTDKDIGNSEVGHNALGAGKIYDQGAKLVNKAIASGEAFAGDCWQEQVRAVREHRGTLHLLGLLSDGNVHAHEQHLHAMLRAAKKSGVERVRIHVLWDGRDVGERTAEVYLDRLNSVLGELEGDGFEARIASGGGRMKITMDRYEADWEMVRAGWRAHVLGDAPRYPSAQAYLEEMRRTDLSDQNLPPFVVADDQGPVGTIEDGDAVILYNFRGDRAIEISRAFTESDFDAFDRERVPRVLFAGMMQYDGDLGIPPRYLVAPPTFSVTLSQHLLGHGVRQFACSETQKFGHVTYFWNGNRSGYLDRDRETYLEIPSDGGISFDERPWMKAAEIAEATIKAMDAQSFDFGRINLANGDMVGHTGNFDAAVLAVSTVDLVLGWLLGACQRTGTALMVTADHGNADTMFDGDAQAALELGQRPKPRTSHTLSPVPFHVWCPEGRSRYQLSDDPEAGLAHVANTVCTLLGLPESDDFLSGLLTRVKDPAGKGASV